jgi:hypothetical protein
MLIARMFGLSAATGLTLGLIRRVRGIFWAAVGGICLVVLSKSRKRGESEDNFQVPSQVPKNPRTSGQGHVAVILAHNLLNAGSFGERLSKVGALPVLLRAILGAQKAGAARIVVVLNAETRCWVQRDLQSTGRLPNSVEWFQLGDGSTFLPSLLGQLGGEVDEPLILIAGDRTYHPSLHRRAAEWNGDGEALAFTSGSHLVGIYALSRNVAIDIAAHSPANVGCLEELHAWLSSTHAVECEPVQEDKWQRVLTPQDRALDE